MNLLSLPVDVREMIYGYVWCHNRYVRFGVESVERTWTTTPNSGPLSQIASGPQFQETPTSKYPPASSTGQVKPANSEVSPAPATAAGGSKNKSKKSASRVIEFNVEAFLKDLDWYDNDDDFEDEDEFEDSEDEDGGLNRKKRYKLDCFTPVNLALFYTTRQIYRESWPVFYKQRTFVFDTCGIDAIRFLNALPAQIRFNISSIGLTGYIFMGDDSGSRVAWSGDEAEPKYLKNGLQLHTPFAAFLATKMPKLQEVYYYFPYSGEEDFYATWAPEELSMMLMHGRIQRLCHVISGEKAKDVLETHDSETCHRRLMGNWWDGEALADSLWHRVDTGPRSSDRKDVKKWVDDQAKFVEENKRMFPWKWAERDIDMGGDGNVQAVIACTR
ncbi:hypothetical protein PRZ48_005134 [Zasmidium cellare]|uniref:Uncharacterized protein n=1 Tax=Zasmidium cellare TaxID=395010 RepID=A0ABR0ETP9_ZASCE|nr:hypothetical protein PRZ48_005134 [Zasmidium cellare]